MDGKKQRVKWEGGYVHQQKDGRPLYVIERQWSGRRFHISTRAHSARAAYEHLRRFEADPIGYERAMAEAADRGDRLELTADLVQDFRSWMLGREVPSTRKHANEMASRLADWIEDLGGRDLRKLDLALLKGALDKRKVGRQHRVIAIKAICAWLRTERHLLSRTEDVTQDLRVPQARPEKHKRRKAVEISRVRAVLPHLSPVMQDVLTLASATGWHTTELQRFARRQESEILTGPPGTETLAVLVVRHKSGSLTRTPIRSPHAADAARRLHERGTFPSRYRADLIAAAKAAGVEPFGLGVLRHSVGTWAVEAGALPEVVAEFLGHRDPRTTRRFYIDVAAPTASVDLPTLH